MFHFIQGWGHKNKNDSPHFLYSHPTLFIAYSLWILPYLFPQIHSLKHLLERLFYFVFFPFQDMASVTVAFASVPRTGRGRTVTAPGALTPVCPTWVCCAVEGVSVCAGSASAHSPVPTGLLVTSALPALMPVPWRSEPANMWSEIQAVKLSSFNKGWCPVFSVLAGNVWSVSTSKGASCPRTRPAIGSARMRLCLWMN